MIAMIQQIYQKLAEDWFVIFTQYMSMHINFNLFMTWRALNLDRHLIMCSFTSAITIQFVGDTNQIN